MISADKLLAEYEFWEKVQTRLGLLGLHNDGVIDEAVKVVCGVFHDALYGNNGVMCTPEQWNEHLECAKRLYDIVKDWQCCEMDEVFFYKARVILWATAIVAGLNPNEVLDSSENPVEEVPLNDITDITTEVV